MLSNSYQKRSNSNRIAQLIEKNFRKIDSFGWCLIDQNSWKPIERLINYMWLFDNQMTITLNW